jgi:hypothetical protein
MLLLRTAIASFDCDRKTLLHPCEWMREVVLLGVSFAAQPAANLRPSALSDASSPVHHAAGLHSWDTLMRPRVQERANYILGRQAEVGFDKPTYNLGRSDSEAVRNLTMSFTSAEAKKRGIIRSTLRYRQRRVKTGKLCAARSGRLD